MWILRFETMAPRGEYFGWDPIFEPDGLKKTYAEMGREEKNKLSHRRLTLDKLKEFLENTDNAVKQKAS